jgi:hypothetical protein
MRSKLNPAIPTSRMSIRRLLDAVKRLLAADGSLDGIVEILHAKRGAVHPAPRERLRLLLGQKSWVKLDCMASALRSIVLQTLDD